MDPVSTDSFLEGQANSGHTGHTGAAPGLRHPDFSCTSSCLRQRRTRREREITSRSWESVQSKDSLGLDRPEFMKLSVHFGLEVNYSQEDVGKGGCDPNLTQYIMGWTHQVVLTRSGPAPSSSPSLSFPHPSAAPCLAEHRGAAPPPSLPISLALDATSVHKLGCVHAQKNFVDRGSAFEGVG